MKMLHGCSVGINTKATTSKEGRIQGPKMTVYCLLRHEMSYNPKIDSLGLIMHKTLVTNWLTYIHNRPLRCRYFIFVNCLIQSESTWWKKTTWYSVIMNKNRLSWAFLLTGNGSQLSSQMHKAQTLISSLFKTRSICPPFCCTTFCRRRRQWEMLLSINAGDRWRHDSRIAFFSPSTDVRRQRAYSQYHGVKLCQNCANWFRYFKDMGIQNWNAKVSLDFASKSWMLVLSPAGATCITNLFDIEMCSKQNGVEMYQKTRKLVQTFWRWKPSNVVASRFGPPCIYIAYINYISSSIDRLKWCHDYSMVTIRSTCCKALCRTVVCTGEDLSRTRYLNKIESLGLRKAYC